MADQFTEVTNVGCFERLKEAFAGVVTGFVVLVICCGVLLWNEGRAVETERALDEGAGVVITVSPDTVNPANDKKLVHMTGDAKTTGTISDSTFGVTLNALKLKRTAELYQWKENKKTEEHAKGGGSSQRVTTYSYDKVWSETLNSSSSFSKQEGHTNPASMLYTGKTFTAAKATLGAFTLSQGLMNNLNEYQPLPVTADMLAKLPSGLQGKTRVSDEKFYIGTDPASPQVGDYRIGFQSIIPQTVSIVARQAGNSFEAYTASSGGKVELIKVGSHSAAEMIQTAKKENEMLTWAIRFAMLIFIFFSLMMIARPFSVAASVIPILGDLMSMGSAFFAVIGAIGITFTVIAIGWLWFRPWVSIPLILLAVAITIGAWLLLKRRRQAKAAAAVPPAQPPPA